MMGELMEEPNVEPLSTVLEVPSDEFSFPSRGQNTCSLGTLCRKMYVYYGYQMLKEKKEGSQAKNLNMIMIHLG